ncbi:hypothetical protein AB0J35_05010 [Nonomuraea angiospora]|uniref:hypothetical protein n=1 Tax=Nonomuraea angiospora TaxID=46172 RepID=UPI003439CEFA
MPEIIARTSAGETRTIPIPDSTCIDRDALARATCDHGLRLRLHLVDVLWQRDPQPTSEAQIGGYMHEVADRLATALEGDLLTYPAAWRCVCGHINDGSWSNRDCTWLSGPWRRSDLIFS